MSDTFEFTVTFHGLHSLVPTGDGEFLVPLPNLRRGLSQPAARLPAPIPPHLACVVVDNKYVVDGGEETPSGCTSARAVLEYQSPPGTGTRRLYELRRQRVTLRYDGSESGASAPLTELQPHQIEPGGGAPPEDDLAWMPSLERTGIEKAGVFDGRQVNAELVPDNLTGFNRLAGTVLVRSGRLALSGIHRRDDGAAVHVDFAAGDADPIFRQAYFDRLLWIGSAPFPGLELVLTRGRPGFLVERCIQLAPDDGKLEIDIFNQELEDILDVGEDTPSPGVIADPDFAVGYFMSEAWESLVADAAVIPRLPASGPGGSGEACKTGRFPAMGHDPRS